MGISRHDGRGSILDQVGEMGVWECTAQRAEHRCGEDHVADEAQSNDQHAHGATINRTRTWMGSATRTPHQ